MPSRSSRSRPVSTPSRRPATRLIAPLFRFTQVELPWALGPPDGRYLVRRSGDPTDAPAAHVLVLATLGAPERHRLILRRRQRHADPEPQPTPVSTGRATVVDVGEPLPGAEQARAWLLGAGEHDFEGGLEVLNRVVHAYRLVTADPYVSVVSRQQALVARIGYGAGEQVADGLWTDARELLVGARRQRRAKVLEPQARLAAVLAGRERALVCEDLALRARLDLDQGRDRQAALQVMVALDAALAELPSDPTAPVLQDRLTDLRARHEAVAVATKAALEGPLGEADREAVAATLGRIEAALRARAVANA